MMPLLRGFALVAVVLASAGCGRSDATPVGKAEPAKAPALEAATPHARLAPRAPRALAAARLPEDPVAGARSTEQWRERRVSRLRKRQLDFDYEHLADHRAVIEKIALARSRYDRARSEAALSAARAAMPAQLDKIKASVVHRLDTGRGSRLLADYDALLAALATSYPDAKLASLRGDASALTAVQASFDQRVQGMSAWLEEAKLAKTAEASVQAPGRESALSKL
jgi:hypothetical protein